MNNSNPIPENDPVINIIYSIRKIINSSGKIVGSVVLSLLDVILGGFVLSKMLEDSIQFDLFGFSISGSVIGWLLSIVFWYVQIMLWEYILEDGKLTKEDIPALSLAVVIAIVDTFGDSSSILIGTMSSSLKTTLVDINFLGFSLFQVLVSTLFIATTIVTGASEFLNRLWVRSATIAHKSKKKRYNQQVSAPKQAYTSTNPTNAEILWKKATSRRKKSNAGR